MILTEADVPAYLAEKGLADPAAGWTVSASPSRNRNFSAVPATGGPGFFLKQLRVTAPESVLMMQREATVYWLSRNDPDFAPLAGLIPPFGLFDGARKVLVLGRVPGARNLLRHQEEARGFPAPLGEALGKALAAVHHGVGRRMRSDPPRAAFPLEPPGILTAHRGGPLLRWLGPGQMRLVERVREHPVLAPALDRLAATWAFDTFTHGDLKFENCVIASGGGEASRVFLVDWELADFGDPCWDAGCILQAYLYLGLLPTLARPGEGLRERLERAGARREAMRAALQGFWTAYGPLPELLERTLGCAAARLVQMALEVMHGQAEPPAAALSLLETAAEVAGDPGGAVRLLGLGGEAGLSEPASAPRSGG
jgi:aminoglycoside phosphotransferase (APT) family kinase protein